MQPNIRPPDEEDLQKLYNDVLAGFSEESPIAERPPPTVLSPKDRDLDSVYNSYSVHAPDDDLAKSQNASYNRTSPVSPGPISATSAGYPASPRENNRRLPTNPPSSPPQSTGRYRPLPRLPGASATSPVTSGSSMPVPDVYAFASHESSDSIGNRYLPQTTTLNGAYGTNAVPSKPASPPAGRTLGGKIGLPPRPSTSGGRTTRADSSSLLDAPRSPSPYSATQSYPMPTPEVSNWDSHFGANRDGSIMARSSSLRPAGASAPIIPGYNGGQDSRDEPLSGILTSPNGFYSESTNFSDSASRLTTTRGPSFRAMDPGLRAYSPNHGPSPSLGSNNVNSSSGSSRPSHMRISSEDVLGSSSHMSNSYLPSPTPYNVPGTQLDRSTSTGSTTSSSIQPSILGRNTSTTTNNTYGDAIIMPSSPATTINRVNSTKTTSSDGLYATESPYYGHQGIPESPAYSGAVEGSSQGYNTDLTHIAGVKQPLGLHETEDYDDDWEGDYSEPGDDDFVNFSLLSHIAVRLRDKVPRGTHVKGSIPYPRAFTGKDIVSTIQSQIQRDLLINHGVSTSDRRAALQVARSLQCQLFFYEVEWGGRILQDGVEDVYMFLDDQESGSEAHPHPHEREELPTGVITFLTRCYSSSCGEGEPCYSYTCPLRKSTSVLNQSTSAVEIQKETKKEWSKTIDKEILDRLPASEVRRQTIIHKVIGKEEDYLQDLDIVETLFIKPLRESNVIKESIREDFIEEVFGNILDLRQCNRNLLEELYVRQREYAPVIQRIGDIFLGAATQFRLAYPIYLGHLPLAEKRLKDEIDENSEFRLFLEECYRHMARTQQTRCLNLKHFLTRPSEHLQKYPVLLEAIYHETIEENSDKDYLSEAMQAIKNLQTIAQLRSFQTAMGKGPTGQWEWHDLLSKEERLAMDKKEAKRQSIIFEVIKGEMLYVKDLESIETMYVQQLREMDPPIIPRDRLESFIRDVFHNFSELHAHHRRLLDTFFEIQREEHPTIRSIVAPIFDAALNFREAYMEYVPNYPIAAYRIEDEMATNPAFKTFVEERIRHPDSDRKLMKEFIFRPIPRLLRYDLLLSSMLDETPQDHEDVDAIPQVLDVLKSLGKETQPGVKSAEQKVDLWRYNSNLVFKPGEAIDMDLLDENRSLIHTGKLLRQPDTGFEWNGWSELTVILFDNYLVMTKTKEREGVTKYHVNRRPIPLDLLTLANFVDPGQQRSTGIGRILRGGERTGGGHGELSAGPMTAATTPESAGDSRMVYPCTVHHNGRLGGLYTLYAETAQIRAEWKQKLEEAIGLRKAVQENNKVFEIETLSADTFLIPSVLAGTTTPSWNQENSFTGKVTCSVPFTTADGRGLVAIGCAEGVWIGFRHDSRSMRRVLHLKQVTQCAMLSDFGIFLVLADKSLFAYHIEALVPSSPQGAHNTQPQKLNGNKDVHFFSVGSLHGRTLVIYMKKKGLDSVFRVLEPVMDKISEKTKAPTSLGSRLGLRTPRSEWFRVYRDFFLPSESFDLIFLKAKIAILCTKGFEIMDLTDFKSVTIPQRDDPRLEKLAKRCESCRPIGMFRSSDEEFLLCYDEFGLYVDKHGDPSRLSGTIEWEGTADRVALHGKYILLFDTRFIEVRHVETGRLAQIIPGNDVRCIWDGRGVSSNNPDWSDTMSQEPRVHGVVNAQEAVVGGASRTSRAVTQHVFELVPTIPLYLPGSLASPSASAYFPQSSSPPHSPRLNPAWR